MTDPLVLVIEDNDHLADIFAAGLQAANFKFEIVRDGRTALDRLAVITPDIVVLDLHVPKVSGQDILKSIRGDIRLARTKVMLATADPILAARLQNEANLVLLKPITSSQLRDMATYLHHKQWNPIN